MNYPNPFIPQRADPYVVKGPDGFYYFTASYPAFMNVDAGYDRIILRKSDTVSGVHCSFDNTLITTFHEFASKYISEYWRVEPYSNFLARYYKKELQNNELIKFKLM